MTTTTRQAMLALCFLSYRGVTLTATRFSSGCVLFFARALRAVPRSLALLTRHRFRFRPKSIDIENTLTERRLIEEGLRDLEALRGRYDLVWGPSLFRFPCAVKYANFMYVVREVDNPDSLVVVIRGTDLTSVTDWIREDLQVRRQRPWTFGGLGPDTDAKISKAAATGLEVLLQMEAVDGVPGAGTTVIGFLRQIVAQAQGPVQVRVTGHSKGGELCSSLALFLRDNQGVEHVAPDHRWDPDARATVGFCSFAGPTAGNEAFAAHSGERLGENARRVDLDLDALTLFWNQTTMRQVPNIYEPEISFTTWEKLVLRFLIFVTRFDGYTQIPVREPIENPIDTRYLEVIEQMLYQHFYGYADALEVPQCSGDLQNILDGELFTIYQ